MKVLLRLLFIFISYLTIAQCPIDLYQNPTVSNNGMLLYYPFDGNTTNQGSGTNSATVNGPVYSTGICGQGMQFDGIDDNIEITPYVPLTGDITIAAWVYVDSLTPNLAIFSTRDQCASTYRGSSQGEFGINYYTTTAGGPNRIRYVVNTHQNCTGFSAGDRYYMQNYTYASGSWHFVALTVQNNASTGRTVNYFVDCQLYSSNHYMTMGSSASFDPLNNNKSFIGAAADVSPWIYSFNGIIDEFRLYNRVLSLNEMQSLYYKCKPLQISISNYQNACNGDSAIIELINTQSGVEYQLFDSTNQQLVGSQQSGNCGGSLFFNTGLVYNQTDFYIKAVHSSSQCDIVLDTVITLNPTTGILYNSTDSIEICENDSFLYSGVYYFPSEIIVDSSFSIDGCDSVSTLYLLSRALPSLDIGNDISFCDGDSTLLSVQYDFYSILWNTADTTKDIYVKNAGTYWVTVSDSICENKDTIVITSLSNAKIVIPDNIICGGDEWDIELNNQFQYNWFDGSTMPGIVLMDSGIYWVEITDICKTYTDSFRLTLENCDCKMIIPNAFTPNGDGINDEFYPVIDCDIIEYRLYIYNRWGSLMYQTYKQDDKWDGTFDSKKVTAGVYFFTIEFKSKYKPNMVQTKTGSITLFK